MTIGRKVISQDGEVQDDVTSFTSDDSDSTVRAPRTRRRRAQDTHISADRPSEIWAMYVDGNSQTQIAERIGISQQRVSQILAEYIALVPKPDKDEIIAVMLEQIRVAFVATMPKVRRGDSVATRDMLRLQERLARMLGIEASPEVGEAIMRYIIESEPSAIADGDDIIQAIT